jgi:DNA-binding SARP family transcriptional activator
MRLARAVLASLVLGFLMVGVPIALVAFGRLPGWNQVTDLPGEMLTDTTAFALLTLIAWAAWSVFVPVVVLELAAELTGARRWRLPAGVPFQASARRLVVALTMSATLSGPVVARVGTAPALPAAAEMRVGDQASAVTPTAVAPTPRQANVRIAAQLPVDLPEAPHAATDAPTVTVVVGDTPWGLADRYLGSGIRWREIWNLNRGTPQPDGRAWVTEDLIHPDWVLRLPADAINTARPAPAPSRSDPAPSGEPTPPAASHEDGTPRPEDDPQDERRSSTTSAPDANGSPPRTVGHNGHDTDPAAADEDTPSAMPGLIGITGATVVATALAFQIRRRRQRRMIVTAQADWGPTRAEDASTEQSIAAASDMPVVQWAGHHLAVLVTHLVPGRLKGAPVAVELSDESGLELLWDSPNPSAPAPWTATDGGWAWSLAYDPDSPTPDNDEPAGIPGLITVGRRNGRQLLIDLEAFGSVAVHGDPSCARDLVRAMTVELGASEELASAQVSVAGLDIDGADQLPRLQVESAADAFARVRSTADATADALERSYSPSTFDYRLGGEAWTDVVTVVTDNSSDETAAIIHASRPRLGVATIVLGEAPDAAAHIVVEADGTARLEPVGLTFDAAGLPAESAASALDVLDALDEPVEADPTLMIDRPSPRVRQSVSGTGDTPSVQRTLDEALEDADAEPVWPQLLVKVLGRPHVPDRPKLKRRELGLVVYLACRGEPTSASNVQHAVWNGKAIATRTLWNVITATRSALGEFEDGTPAMLPSERAHHMLALAPGVRTDLQRLHDLYEHAQAAPSNRAMDLLRQAVDLIEGQPFDGADYEWAHHTELLVADATKLIENVVEHLVGLATAAGRTDLARHAITQGLRALPGNEVLYRARMRVEYDAGNLASVRAAYTELESFLSDIDAEPTQLTVDLYRSLRIKHGRHAS